MRSSVRKAQRKYHRAQADRLAGQLLRSLHAEPDNVDGRDPMWARRYHHLERLDNLA